MHGREHRLPDGTNVRSEKKRPENRGNPHRPADQAVGVDVVRDDIHKSDREQHKLEVVPVVLVPKRRRATEEALHERLRGKNEEAEELDGAGGLTRKVCKIIIFQ